MIFSINTKPERVRKHYWIIMLDLCSQNILNLSITPLLVVSSFYSWAIHCWMKVFLTYDLIQWPGLIKWAILLKHLIKILVIIDMPDMPSFDPVFAVCHWTLCSKNQNFHTHYFFLTFNHEASLFTPLWGSSSFLIMNHLHKESEQWIRDFLVTSYQLWRHYFIG